MIKKNIWKGSFSLVFWITVFPLLHFSELCWFNFHIDHRWYRKLGRDWFEGRDEIDKRGFITACWDCIRIDPPQLYSWTGKQDCFITKGSRCHTRILHLLGMRPQIATHNNWDSSVRINSVPYNPKPLSWRLVIIERQKTEGSWLEVVPSQDGLKLPSCKNGLQHSLSNLVSNITPESHTTTRNRAWSSHNHRVRCFSSVRTYNFWFKAAQQPSSNMMLREF